MRNERKLLCSKIIFLIQRPNLHLIYKHLDSVSAEVFFEDVAMGYIGGQSIYMYVRISISNAFDIRYSFQIF